MRHFSPGLVLISSKDKLWNRPQPFLALITLLSSRSVFPIICISQQGFFFFFFARLMQLQVEVWIRCNGIEKKISGKAEKDVKVNADVFLACPTFETVALEKGFESPCYANWFCLNYELLRREKSQPGAAESRLHVYWMPMRPTNLFSPEKRFKVFGEIAEN